MDKGECLRRLSHVAIHYLLVLDTPLVDKPVVCNHVLAYSLYTCYRDLVECCPEGQDQADFTISAVSQYRRGEISLETAIARIDAVTTYG